MEAYIMDWLDYREKLGIGFSDKQKIQLFMSNIITIFAFIDAEGDEIFDDEETFNFYFMTGIVDKKILSNKDLMRIFNKFTNFREFLSHYIAVINSKHKEPCISIDKEDLMQGLEKSLLNSRIPFETMIDEKGNYFVFPKGAEELDKALVSEPLSWLSDYPKTQKLFSIALKQYSDEQYPRDVADNLRKSLEVFLQEFLGNEKNLESNKTEICKKLSELNVDSSLSPLYSSVINAYKNSNDSNAKHNDRIDKEMLEFLLYQTGLLIRAVITAKQNSEQDSN